MDGIPYGRHEITAEDIAAVTKVLKGDALTQGPTVREFEDAFSKFVGADFALAVNSGTAALHLAALALGVKAGDKVLVASNTFVASANCVRYCGGDVEFLDIDPLSYCIDFDFLEQKLKSAKPDTYKGIVVVDFAGYAVDMERLRKIADQYGLWIIEDACHALGAKFKNSEGEWSSVGNGRYADLTVFSFHPVKHLAMGEGGMVTASNRRADLFNQLTRLRSHGITKDPQHLKSNHGGWYYEMQDLGYNYRVPDVLCALGLSQLKRIDSNIERRREIAKTYEVELSGLSLKLPDVPSSVLHAYHLYVIRTPNRLEVYNDLREHKIFTQVHYIPVYQQPYYVNLYGSQSLSECDRYYKEALSLPMYHSLKESDQAFVIEQVKRFLK